MLVMISMEIMTVDYGSIDIDTVDNGLEDDDL